MTPVLLLVVLVLSVVLDIAMTDPPVYKGPGVIVHREPSYGPLQGPWSDRGDCDCDPWLDTGGEG